MKLKEFVFICECGNPIRKRGFQYSTEKAWYSARCNVCGSEMSVRYRK
jgi:translation initiation factor 2 beta subunit (eIF-2beta)/eIF-5